MPVKLEIWVLKLREAGAFVSHWHISVILDNVISAVELCFFKLIKQTKGPSLKHSTYMVISLRLRFRRNFLSVLHLNLVSSPIKGILEIFYLTTRCIPMDILAWHIFYGLLIGFNKIFITKLQNFKPCIWDF
jgi:hypothetical protein